MLKFLWLFSTRQSVFALLERALLLFVVAQIIEELESYDSHANRSFTHTWYYGEERYQKVYFPAPSYGIDSNTTFSVIYRVHRARNTLLQWLLTDPIQS